MPDDANNLTCEQFQNQLAELIGSGVGVEDNPNARACSTCRKLLLELEAIAEAARYRRFGSEDDSEST